MRVVKMMGRILLVFLLTLGLIGGVAVMLISHTVLNKAYILKQLTEQNYYERIQTDLKNGFEEYQYQSGLPEEIFANLYTEEWVKEEVDSMLGYVYEGTEKVSHVMELEEKLTQNVNQYLNEKHLVLSEKELQNIETFKDLMVNVYEGKINVLSNWTDKIAKGIQVIQGVMAMGQKVVLGVLVVIVGLIFLLNWKEIGASIGTLSASLLAMGILLQLGNFVITSQIDIENVLLFSQSWSDLAKAVVYDMLMKMCWVGWLGIGVGILGIVGSSFAKRKGNNQ